MDCSDLGEGVVLMMGIVGWGGGCCVVLCRRGGGGGEEGGGGCEVGEVEVGGEGGHFVCGVVFCY